MSDKMYFIQDTRQYVGNCILFHAKGSGYTTHLDEAREFTEEEARAIERNRDTDKALPADQVRAAASLQVDVQRLRLSANEYFVTKATNDAHAREGVSDGFTIIGGMRHAEGECSDPRDRFITHYELPATVNLANVDAKCARCGAQVVNLKWSDSQ